MANKILIGPYSAYAIAVKYGYQGTEEEWIKEQETNRTASEQAAQNAAASATAAAGSAAAAQSSQRAAEGSARTAEGEAERAKTEADTAANSANTARTAANQANQAKEAAATSADAAAGSAANARQSAGAADTSAGQAASSANQAAGSAAAAGETLTQVQTAGQEAQQKVKDAETEALDKIAAAAPALPAVSTDAAWQSVTVKPDGSGYNLAALAPIEATIRPTVTGNPAVCENSAAWGLQGLKLYGKSVQNGTPSPENPVPIVSAGDGGRISVALAGSNMLNYKEILSTGYTKRLDVSLDGNVFSVSVTEDGDAYFGGYVESNIGISYPVGYRGSLFPVVPGSNIKIVVSNPWFKTKLFCFVDKDYRVLSYISGDSATVPEKSVLATVRIGNSTAKTSDGTQQTTFMVCLEDYTGDFVPYQGCQSFAISTPSGLPCIPVASGGNYTDASGQQWVCCYADCAERKIHYPIKKYYASELRFALNEAWTALNDNFAFAYAVLINSNPVEFALSNVFNSIEYTGFVSTIDHPIIMVETIAGKSVLYVAIEKTALNEVSTNGINQYLSDIQAEFVAANMNPSETFDIPPEEIAAYRALTTYSGATVVSTAEPVAGIEAQYIMDGTAAWNKINAAIAQIGAANTQTYASYEDLSGAVREGVNKTE